MDQGPLGLLLLSYWLLKYTIMSQVPSNLRLEHFTLSRESSHVDKVLTELTYREFLTKIVSEENFRSEFINILKRSRFGTYFFETPKVSKESLDDKFEFILSSADALKNVRADKFTFQDYFGKCRDSTVVTFPNLGQDAVLVVPCPPPSNSVNHYSSLGPFLRTADNTRVHDFWIEAARTMLQTVKEKVGLN